MGPPHVRDFGFTILHDGGSHPQLDLVFIHGIQGHPRRTWSHSVTPKPRTNFWSSYPFRSRNPAGGTESPNQTAPLDPFSGLWPAKILSLDFPDARILTYGYDSCVSNFFGGATSQNNIVTLAGGFLNDLATERAETWKRPLIIVSHSMGGLVTKEALRRASTEPEKNADLRDVLDSTIALVFFGTPHRGGAYTNLALTATKIAKAAGFDVHDQNIRDLKGDSPVLTLLRRDFAQLLDSDNFEVSTFQEALGYHGAGLLKGKIVPDESSVLDHRNERVNTINANHMDMCRFKDEDDDGYRKFKAEIARHRLRLQGSARKDCIGSFFVPQMSDRLIQIAGAQAQTLSWIYDEPGPGIATWLRSGSGVFWIQGKPGSGKSTAMKFMLQDERTLDVLNTGASEIKFDLIGCFFTDRADKVQASWTGILHSMIYQLLSQNYAAARVVLPFWEEKTRQRTQGGPLWDANSIEPILLKLRSEANPPLKVCFLVDAIDEHDGDHTRMCNFLHELCSLSGAKSVFKICIASRLQNKLRDLFASDPTMCIHDWTRRDIQHFVKRRLSLHPRWDNVVVEAGAPLAARIIHNITSRAQGVFLWVRLIVDELLEGLTNGDSLLELELLTSKVPDDLKGFFAHIIGKIKEKYYLELVIIIGALLHSRGALQAPFLMLVLRANLPKSKGKAVPPNVASDGTFDFKGFSRRLQSRCGGLIEMVPATNTTNTLHVQFLHQTVREYFLEDGNLPSISQSGKVESGITIQNGHSFLLNGYLEWLQRPRVTKLGEDAQSSPGFVEELRIEEISSDVIYHTSAIERGLNTCQMRLLGKLEDKITQQHTKGDLWPFTACGINPIIEASHMYPIEYEGLTRTSSASSRNYRREGRFPSPNPLLMLAITLGWKCYIHLKTGPDAKTTIQNIGVRQFAYLGCPVMMKEAKPLWDSAAILLESGVDITSCQEITSGCHADALGFVMTSHLLCIKGIRPDHAEHVNYDDHYQVFRLLLVKGAKPWGKCFHICGSNPENIEVVTITEALISRSGLSANLKLINLLAEFCPKVCSLAAELFDTSLDKVLESESLKDNFDEEAFNWLRRNGAYISESLALRIYRPFIESLKGKFEGTQTYLEALEFLSADEIPDPDVYLDTELMEYYRNHLGESICQRDEFFLQPAQRKPEYYSHAARLAIAEFNPHWPVEEVPAESTSINFRGIFKPEFWQRFNPSGSFWL